MMNDECDTPSIDLSDDDVFEAMQSIPGYLDITPADFRAIYTLAFRLACRRIATSITAREIMSAPVITARVDAPLREVADLMSSNGISGLPVLAPDGSVAGVISEKDFLKRLGSGATTTFMGIVSECLRGDGCIAVAIRARSARDIMTAPAVTVAQSATLAEITDLFNRRNINRVPVVDDAHRLSGIVSRADIIRGSLIAQGRKH